MLLSSLNRTIRYSTRQVRGLAAVTAAPDTIPFQIFDRQTKRIQRDTAALKHAGTASRTVDYLRDEVADRMVERLEDIKRKFKTVLDLGSGPGHFAKLIETSKAEKCIMVDSSLRSLKRDPDSEFEVEVDRIHADEEGLLQIVASESQEAIVSCLSLHWVNDLPGTLVQINRALVPDGLFLAAMMGGETLFELRTALQLAEVEREGGISPHVSPMTDTRDVSNLLSRAGFTLLTVDVDEVQINYPSIWELMDDLRDMGESNAIIGRRHIIHRDTLAAASAIYKGKFLRLHEAALIERVTKELHGNADGSIPATFQIIFMANRMETFSLATKTFGAWDWPDKSEGDSLNCTDQRMMTRRTTHRSITRRLYFRIALNGGQKVRVPPRK